MKILGGFRGTKKEDLIQRMSEIHIKKNNAVNKFYQRADQQSDASNGSVLVVNENETNNSDGSVVILFNDVFYYFLKDKFPEEEGLTKEKLSLVNFLIQTDISGVIKKEAENNNKEIVFNRFFAEKYDHLIPQPQGIRETWFKLDFKIYNTYVLVFKDDNNQEFTKTHTIIRHEITDKFLASIKCPISDSQTTVKDGFNANDNINVFIKNVNTQREVKLILSTNVSLTAQDLKTITITDININQKDYIAYNKILPIMLGNL
jgi:hypothetical protein